MRRVLVTGASGFIARHLIEALVRDGDTYVLALTRRPDALAQHSHVEVVQGSVLDTEHYRSLLPDLDAVVHLAAATGKATPQAFEEVNVEGTARLATACREANARPILHVSTVAVSYPNVDLYPYALSKKQAEDIVRTSGVPFTILRPTIVLGRGSAAWESFSALVRPAVILVPGNGRVHVQPVHVDDLATVMATLIREGTFEDKTVGVGGPEKLTLQDFLTRAHAVCHGGTARRLPLPLAAVLPVLRLGERLAFSLVPATAGQFSVFQFDSSVSESGLMNHFLPNMQSVDTMLAQCCA